MNNKLTRQQAWETLEWYLNMMQVLDESMTLEGKELTIRDLLTVLDDSHEGFSNRETWETVNFLKKNMTEFNQFDLTARYLKHWVTHSPTEEVVNLGSLWRVNWDEVANALLGGE